MRLSFRFCFFFFIPLQMLLPLCLQAQQSSDGMQVSRDEQGNINNAMYFKDGKPLYKWAKEKKATKFHADWTVQKVLDYLNRTLDTDLTPSLATSICLERVGDYFLNVEHDFENTEKYYLAATHLLEDSGNITRAGYMYYYLGILYLDWDKAKLAESFFVKAVKIYSELPDPVQSNYTLVLKSIFSRYIQSKHYTEAIPYLEAYLALGDESGSSAGEQSSFWLYLGDAYWKSDREKDAVAAYLRSVPLAQKQLGPNCAEFQNIATIIANQLYQSGFRKEAVPLYLAILDADSVFAGPDAEFEICTRLYEYYAGTVELDKLLPVLERMLPAIRSKAGGESEIYISMLNTLGLLYERDGKFDVAAKYLEDCLVLRKKTLPASDPLIGTSMLELGVVNIKMYNTDRAMQLADKGMAIISGSGKTDDYGTGLYLSVMGFAAFINRDYKEAETIFNQILKNAPRGGYYELEYAITLGTLGTIYWYLGDYKRSEKVFLDAIATAEKAGKINWREYGNLKGNLSMVDAKTGNFQKALESTNAAIESYRSINGERHPDYLIQLANRSMYLEALGDVQLSVNEGFTANAGVVEMVDLNLLYWSDIEMETFISFHINRFFEYYHSLYFRNLETRPELAGNIYNNLLFLKGLLLQSSRKLQEAVSVCNDSILHTLTKRQKECRVALEKLYAQPSGERPDDPLELEQEFIMLQKQLKQRVALLDKTGGQFNNLLMAGDYSYTGVREALSPGQAAIEFLSFRYYDIGRETDSVYYCALVLRSDAEWPVMVFLTLGSRLENLVRLHPDQIYDTGNPDLYTLIWEPLERYLKGMETVFYSPAGLLHRISFAALPIGDHRVLSDRYKLINLASTRNLIVARQSPKIETETGFIFGGIDYNTTLRPETKSLHQSVVSPSDTVFLAEFRSLRGAAWDFLPGTKAEASKISQLLTNGRIYTRLVTGGEATEESMKSLSGQSPAIIHIASHGFSFPPFNKLDSQRNMIAGGGNGAFTLSQIPLMRSGLLFAGANNAWASGTTDKGSDDGILTAYEISNLDLSGCNLMVLSACETGLGDIEGNEGVLGLQRALFMAGVNGIVVSLWEVPDLETMELMTLFYENIVKGRSPEASFHMAQMEMKARYREQPSLWAGFVFIR
jgi:CHAT domain-containing protein/TolA-binding protein